MRVKKLIYSNVPVELAGVTPFAIGDHRFCFQHPENPSLCIKVNRPGKDRELKAAAPWYKKWRSAKSFNDNWNEYLAFNQPAILQNRPAVWQHVPRCYGWVETDIGEGLVTDFYADKKTGGPAETLERYLEQSGFDSVVENALQAFYRFLRETRVLTKNLLPHNLVMAEDDDGHRRIVIIDGFGLASMLPLAKISEWAAARHIEKRIKKLDQRIWWELAGKQGNWSDFQAEGGVE